MGTSKGKKMSPVKVADVENLVNETLDVQVIVD
jgi:hypothetical protein